MSAVRARCADLAARLLDADDQAAVRGDHTELGTPPGRALREILGLIVRRQAALWTHWSPWLAIATVAIPIGLMLSHASRWWAVVASPYAFLYIESWTWAFIENPGAREILFGHLANFLVQCLALIGWSWTAGYVLGLLSRRTLWLSGGVLCLLVVFGTYGTTGGNGIVSPRVVRIVLVLFPALLGMSRSLQQSSLRVPVALLWAFVVAMATAWTAHSLENSVIFGWGVIPSNAGLDGIIGSADDPRPLRLLPLVMVWPTAYILANARRHRWRGKTS